MLHYAAAGLRSACILVAFFLTLTQALAQDGPTVLVGATLIDGTGAPPVDDSVVIINGEHIGAVGRRSDVEIPAGARVIDAAGSFIVPGLVDGHVHLRGLGAPTMGGKWEVFGEALVERISKHALMHLRSGTTTVFDVGGPVHELIRVRDDINTGKRPGARIFTAGPITSADRDYPLPAPRTPAESLHQKTLIRGEFKGVDGARAKVRELAALGVDHIKVYQTGGWDHGYAGYATRVRLEEMVAVVEEATAAGLPVTAHTRGTEGFQNGIKAGLNSFQHVVYCGMSFTDADLKLLAGSPVVIIPTIVAISQFWDGLKDPSFLERDRLVLELPEEPIKELFDIMTDPVRYTRHEYYNMSYAEIPRGRDNLRRLIEAGAPIAMGTDAGTVANFHGTSYREVVELVKAGMTPMQAIVAGTRGTARAFLKQDLGTIETGMRADLLVVHDDPLADITNLERLEHVFKAGRRYEPLKWEVP